MKICLVTTFPPSTGGLSEYGFHIAQELQRNPFLSLTVLGDFHGVNQISSNLLFLRFVLTVTLNRK